MKKNKILLTLLTSACVGMVAGCGETKYAIKTDVVSDEFGYITGGGNYANGETVTLKVYPNEGCSATHLSFIKEGTETPVEVSFMGDNEYTFVVDNGETGNVGSYTAEFSCLTNSPDEDAMEATRTASFVIVMDENGTTNDTLVPAQEVKIGASIKDVQYVDGIEGRLEWYKNYDSTTKQHTDKWNFENDKLLENITLYGKITATNPKEIVETAVENFKKSTGIQMDMGNVRANVKGYDKLGTANDKVEFYFYEDYDLDGEFFSKFIVINNIYYETSNNIYYKLPLGPDSGFNITDIEEFNMFFEHISVKENASSFSFEKVVDGTTGDSITEELVVGKNDKDEDIKAVCYKYLVKDGSGNDYMTLWISNGYVYKTEMASTGKVNRISYVKELASTEPSTIRDIFVIRLESDDAELNAELDEINSSFEKVLKLRPANGETLASLLETDANVKDLLRRYDYEVHDNLGKITDLSTYAINTNKTLDVKVVAKYEDVAGSLEDFAAGGFKITTETIVFETEVVAKEYIVDEGDNVFDLTSKPDSMNVIIWNAMEALEELSDEYYRFEYDAGIYSFYKDKKDSIPYISIKLDVAGEKIEKLFYYRTDTEGKVITYTSTFDYSYRTA